MDANGNVGVSEELEELYVFRLPRATTYKGYIWPGVLFTPERIRHVRSLDFRPQDVLIASYPKSGTTWVSEVVSLVVAGGDVEAVRRRPLHERVPWLELDNSFVWVRFFWLWQLAARALGFTAPAHDDDSNPRVYFTHLPLELLPKRVLDGQVKIIYICRNPKDNAVSFFHFHKMARFLGLQKTTWHEFFPLYTVGKIYCGSWFEHVLGFWRFSKVNPNVLFLKYEEMKKDLGAEVGRIAEFVGVELDEERVKGVVAHCTFGSMKNNRMANRDGVWLFDQHISKFMRKGVVGDWKNYFTVGQNELFDSVYKAKMNDYPALHFDFEPAD